MIEKATQEYIELLEQTLMVLYQKQEYKEMLFKNKNETEREELKERIQQLQRILERNVERLQDSRNIPEGEESSSSRKVADKLFSTL